MYTILFWQKSKSILAFLGNDWQPPHHLQLYLVPIKPILSLMHLNSWPNLRKWIIKNREKKTRQNAKCNNEKKIVNSFKSMFLWCSENLCKLLYFDGVWWKKTACSSLPKYFILFTRYNNQFQILKSQFFFSQIFLFKELQVFN